MNDSGDSVPPGWYPDGQSGQRWWDGTQWGPVGQPPSAPPGTDFSPATVPLPTSPPPTGPPPAGPPPGGLPTSPPPQYAPPAYAAQPGSVPPGQGPTGSGASGRNPKFILGILGGLVGVVVLAIILVLTLGGGDGPSSDDPAETVASFFDAAEDGDCDAAFALLTDNARTTFGSDVGVEECESADPSEAFGDDVSIEIGKARIDGDDATVPVSLADDSDDSGDLAALGLGEFTIDFELRKQDGAWLIDDLGFASLLENLPDLSDLPDIPDLSDQPDAPDSSDLPDDPFSDFPSDFPSDLFSDFPSDFPSDLFSDFPSDLPSDFPSDLFSDFPSE